MASADPLFDQLSATTLADMRRDAVQDNFFIEGAWQRLTRYYHAEDPFFGGTWMQEPFMYNRVNGGAYPPGNGSRRRDRHPPAELRHALWLDGDRWLIPAAPARAGSGCRCPWANC